MSKLLPFLVAAAGASTVSVGGVYMLKQPSKGTGDNKSKQTETKKFLFENVEEFKTKVDDGSEKKCIEGYFAGLKLKTTPASAKEINDSQPDTNTFFKSTKQENDPYQSCLLINWKKDSYGENASKKWKGKFVWLWTFVRGDEGFVSFNVAENKENEQKLKFSGVFYLVGKVSGGSTWEVKYHKEMKTEKSEGKDKIEQNLPKPNTSLTEAKQSFWGFMENKESMDSICKQSECGEGQSKTTDIDLQEFTWKSVDSGEKTLKDCFVDLNWWSSLFGISKFDLSTKLSAFKGTWNKPQ